MKNLISDLIHSLSLSALNLLEIHKKINARAYLSLVIRFATIRGSS